MLDWLGELQKCDGLLRVPLNPSLEIPMLQAPEPGYNFFQLGLSFGYHRKWPDLMLRDPYPNFLCLSVNQVFDLMVWGEMQGPGTPFGIHTLYILAICRALKCGQIFVTFMNETDHLNIRDWCIGAQE